jgi:uncharacterized membrane protein
MPVWWTSVMSGLGSWLVNPGLFLAGAALVSVPIVIHLLNRRKFKIVDWAAMDFLLEADKKNRRRVQLENWLLLLLRCLAVLVLGLLLARPFDSSGLAARIFNEQRFERIVVVDDSLSMQSRIGNRSAMDIVRERLVDLARMFAQEQSENTLTLLLTSNPTQRKFSEAHIGLENVDDIAEQLERIEPSESPARMAETLQELDDYLASRPANVNRVVYFVTDLRRRDWQPAAPASNAASSESPPAPGQTTAAAGSAAAGQPIEMLRKIAKQAKGCFVVDVGDAEDRNLVIRRVTPEKTLVAGVESRFDVVVGNAGSKDIQGVQVKFTAGGAVPLVQTIEQLASGEEASLRFTVAFADDDSESTPEERVAARKVKVEVVPERGGDDDRLAADSVEFFAARVVAGIPTLLVDGDPSASFGKSETFYLKRALRPPGRVSSGVAPEVVTDTELESVDLDKYQVVFLCNVYRLSDQSLDTLTRWVEQGGGLVVFPGGQVDEEFFNQRFAGTGEAAGKRLSPVRLESIVGDESEQQWKNFTIGDEQHPVLKDFAGQQNPILSKVQVYRWWKGVMENGEGMAPASVLMRLTDAEDSPALVERPYGKGRVVVSTLPCDADWSTWASDPSYILIMQEMVRYLAAGDARDGALRVGEPLRQEIDLTQADLDAEVVLPGLKKVNVQASQVSGGEAKRWLLEHPGTNKPGFYELKISQREGGVEPVLFAANVDPSEGDLRRANVDAMEKELSDVGVRFVSGGGSLLAGLGAQLEIWKYLLWLLVGLLLGEQVLGWLFGRRR